MYIKITKNIKGNNLFVAKTAGIFTFESFQAIKLILNKNKKLYNYIWFKKIPTKISTLFIKHLDIIIELLVITNIRIKFIRTIASKLSFEIHLVSLKV